MQKLVAGLASSPSPAPAASPSAYAAAPGPAGFDNIIQAIMTLTSAATAPLSGAAAPAAGPAEAAEVDPRLKAVGQLLNGISTLPQAQQQSIASALPQLFTLARGALGAGAPAPAASTDVFGTMTQFAQQMNAMNTAAQTGGSPGGAAAPSASPLLGLLGQLAGQFAAAGAASAQSAAPASAPAIQQAIGLLGRLVNAAGAAGGPADEAAVKDLARQLSQVTTQMTADSMPAFARDNFIKAHADVLAPAPSPS